MARVGVEDAVAEVVRLASDLIRIDTTNRDDPHAPGTERPAAEHGADLIEFRIDNQFGADAAHAQL